MQDKKKELILWIGPVLDEPELEGMVKSGECVTTSANLAEWNFLKYFMRETESHVLALSAIRTIEWPKNHKLHYRERPAEAYFDGKLQLLNIGYCNVFGLSHLARSRALVAKAKDIAAGVDDDVFVNLFVYSMHLPFMKAAAAFKAAHPNCCYKMIVPDLPLNMNTSTSLRKVLKRLDWLNIQRGLSNVDGFILYTQQMAEYLHLNDGQYMVCEGIANLNLLNYVTIDRFKQKSRNKTILYAGNLDAKYRIENLVYAFGELNDHSLRLCIYGKGTGMSAVAEACAKTMNASFGGYRSNEEILKLMQNAYFVINPRPIDIDCAEFSCPSKTLEAMAIGVAFASSKLPGIPEEYWRYIHALDCTDVESLSASLKQLLSLDVSGVQMRNNDARLFIERRSQIAIRSMLMFRGDGRE